MKKINHAASKIVALTMTVIFLLSISSGLTAMAGETSVTLGSRQVDSGSVEQGVYTDSENLPAIIPTDAPLGMGYGLNGKFIAPITPPEAGAIPISNRAELEAIKNNLSGSYYLAANIDLSGAEWVPIGNYNNPFNGILDGQGHVISNLTSTGDKYKEYNGLFGYVVSGMIKNIGVEDTYIDVPSYCTGGICGYSNNNSFISNCYNTGTITSSTSFVGGICGWNDTMSSVSNCYNAGTVTSSSDCGGICGRSDIMSSISNCYNTGMVTSIGSGGGICGWNDNGFFVKNCYNTGTVTSFSSGGGICGGCDACLVVNCYNTGTITSYHSTEGIYSMMGGICGLARSCAISNCYNTGTVNISTSRGGICGDINPSSVSNSYCLDLYGNPFGIQLTNVQMQDQASFVGFDFSTVWGISPNFNNGYPYLQNLRPGQSISINYTLNITSGTGGTISGSPSAQYAAGEQITLTATADSGYLFDSWTTTGVTLADINAPSITFTMPANSVTLTANFIPQPPELSGDATLSSLAVSAGTLNPTFDPNTISYAVTVGNNISSIDITATANHAKATVAATGTKALAIGANSFNVKVIAENGATKTYTIIVTRAANNNIVTVNGIAINYTMVNGIVVLQPSQKQMSAILNASGSNIVFDLSGQNAVDLYVGAGWFKNIDKTITIITSGGSASVKTKSLWNNSGKTRLVTVRNNNIDFKNIL